MIIRISGLLLVATLLAETTVQGRSIPEYPGLYRRNYDVNNLDPTTDGAVCDTPGCPGFDTEAPNPVETAQFTVPGEGGPTPIDYTDYDPANFDPTMVESSSDPANQDQGLDQDMPEGAEMGSFDSPPADFGQDCSAPAPTTVYATITMTSTVTVTDCETGLAPAAIDTGIPAVPFGAEAEDCDEDPAASSFDTLDTPKAKCNPITTMPTPEPMASELYQPEEEDCEEEDPAPAPQEFIPPVAPMETPADLYQPEEEDCEEEVPEPAATATIAPTESFDEDCEEEVPEPAATAIVAPTESFDEDCEEEVPTTIPTESFGEDCEEEEPTTPDNLNTAPKTKCNPILAIPAASEPADFLAPEPEPMTYPETEPEPAPMDFAEPEPEPMNNSVTEPEPMNFSETEPMPTDFAEPEPAPLPTNEPETIPQMFDPVEPEQPENFEGSSFDTSVPTKTKCNPVTTIPEPLNQDFSVPAEVPEEECEEEDPIIAQPLNEEVNMPEDPIIPAVASLTPEKTKCNPVENIDAAFSEPCEESPTPTFTSSTPANLVTEPTTAPATKCKPVETIENVQPEEDCEEDPAPANIQAEEDCEEDPAPANIQAEEDCEEDPTPANAQAEEDCEEDPAPANAQAEEDCEEEPTPANAQAEEDCVDEPEATGDATSTADFMYPEIATTADATSDATLTPNFVDFSDDSTMMSPDTDAALALGLQAPSDSTATTETSTDTTAEVDTGSPSYLRRRSWNRSTIN
ncbi:hypothetical protein H4R33_000646 [Dimargaris cristalligena]|nr:hypothetical protein H4R33_000646 [Dimargaris cristalligena]